MKGHLGMASEKVNFWRMQKDVYYLQNLVDYAVVRAVSCGMIALFDYIKVNVNVHVNVNTAINFAWTGWRREHTTSHHK